MNVAENWGYHIRRNAFFLLKILIHHEYTYEFQVPQLPCQKTNTYFTYNHVNVLHQL